MAKKYLEIDVTKTLSTTLYVCVEDDGRDLNQMLQDIPIAKAISETIHDSDWDFEWNPEDSDYGIMSISEVKAEEAELYTVFDVETQKIKDIE